MIYKTAGIETSNSAPRQLTLFRAAAEGEIGFAAHYPGKLQVCELGAGQSVLVQRDAFLLAESSVAWSPFALEQIGAGLALEKLTGPGTVFIHACGGCVEFDLNAAETIQVDAGCLAACEETVRCEIQTVSLGAVLAILTGPGRAIVQSAGIDRLRTFGSRR